MIRVLSHELLLSIVFALGINRLRMVFGMESASLGLCPVEELLGWAPLVKNIMRRLFLLINLFFDSGWDAIVREWITIHDQIGEALGLKATLSLSLPNNLMQFLLWTKQADLWLTQASALEIV